MKMNQQQLEKMIDKMMNVIKPNGVSNIEFNLEPIDDNEYYMNVTYIVPVDSELLKVNPFEIGEPSRYYWNKELRKSIKNYFGVDVLINNSSIVSKSYIERLKDK